MQAKGLVRFFTIAFAVVCLYQLSFTFISINEERKSQDYAESQVDKSKGTFENRAKGDPIKLTAITDSAYKEYVANYLDSINNEVVFDLGVYEYTFQDCKQKRLNLGLDLQGGMSIVLQVSLNDLIKKMSNYNKDPDFLAAMLLANEKQKNSQQDFVTIFGDAYREIAPGKDLATIFVNEANKEKIKYTFSNEEVLTVIREEGSSAIFRTYEILRSRIDRFGVAQPNINLQELTGRIIVELPGVDNQRRVRKLLQSSAELGFWETYFNTEVDGFLKEANTVLATIQAGKDASIEEQDSAGATILSADETSPEVEDNDLASSLIEEEEKEGKEEELTLVDSTAKDDSISVDSTLDEALSLLSDPGYTGDDDSLEDLSEEEYAQQNPLFSLLRTQSFTDQQNRQRYFISVSAKDTGKFNGYMAIKKVKSVFPPDLRILWGAKPFSKESDEVELFFIKTKGNRNKAALDGGVVTDASQQFDQQSGHAYISMTMNAKGAKDWKRLTGQNLQRRIAIVLDNAVYSAPNVESEISGGKSQISGNFEIDEAKDLANILNSGKLDAPAKIVEEEIVGPSLGKASIDAGMRSLIAGLIIVLLFMVFYYSNSGFIANLALITNLFFIVGVLASFGATLTLPGMAGIVLTIGMAVDANVLIFERVREELEKGSGLRLAIVDGFTKSYSSIIDANLTTLLTAIILSTFGMGPVKGFATVLIIGIFSSMFTAILLSRLMVDWRVRKDKAIHFYNKFTKGTFSHINIDFISKRKIAYTVSGLIIIGGIVSFFTNGFELGVDFKGGRTYVVKFNDAVNTNEVRNALAVTFQKAPVVKTFGGKSQVKITTSYLIDDNSLQADSIVEQGLYNGIKSLISDDLSIEDFNADHKLSSQKVGPTIADDIKNSAFRATLFALIGIFLYILVRFRKWQYGLGAVIALFHNVLLVLTVFSLFGGLLPFSLEIDQTFIAAILTVIGYSINDTVVVFDRVREYLNIHKSKDMTSAINLAINSTLSRTLITSFTTLVVVFILFVAGGEVIRGFSFAILLGIIIGTYSSIFIATPIVVDLTKEKEE